MISPTTAFTGAHVEQPRANVADRLRARALARAREVARCRVGAWLGFGLVDGRTRPIAWICQGIGDDFVRLCRDAPIEWPWADPATYEPRSNGRFVRATSRAGVGSPFPPSLLRRCKPIGLHDVARMVVVHERRMVGWLGVFRATGEPAFSSSDLRRLAAVAPSISEALITADAMERAHPVERASCELILRMDGSVELASSGARALLEASAVRDELRAWAGGFGADPSATPLLQGWRATARRLGPLDVRSPGSGDRILVRLDPVEPLELQPAHLLTPAQRNVAEIAAASATVDEIARSLQMAPATVRAHLRAIYARLGVSSRAELARALDGTAPSADAGSPPASKPLPARYHGERPQERSASS